MNIYDFDNAVLVVAIHLEQRSPVRVFLKSAEHNRPPMMKIQHSLPRTRIFDFFSIQTLQQLTIIILDINGMHSTFCVNVID